MLGLRDSRARIPAPLLLLLAPTAKVNPATVTVYAAALACIVLAFAVYWPRLTDFFVLDDFFFLRAVRNHSFWEVIYRGFTFPSPKPFDEVTLFWRPLLDLYFYVFRVFGLHPEPYHVVNTLLHGVVGGLAVFFVWRLTGSAVGGALTGMLFTIAPTYGFAVTWISQVSELLGAALILGALISYYAYLTAARANRLYYRGTVLLTVLALLSKESTVILFALLPGLALAVGAQERRRSANEILQSLGPVAVLGVAFAVVMLVREYKEGGGAYQLGSHMARNLWDYLKWMVLPYRYGSAEALRAVTAAAFLAAGVGALLLRHRMLAFFFLWAIVALLPFTGFTFGIEFRYTYLATLPFAAFVVSAAVAVVKSLPRAVARPSALLLGLAVALALAITPVQTREQHSLLASNAAQYEAMVTSVRTLCGSMPPESFVYVVGAPYSDQYGIHTPAALNLYYDRVHAVSVRRVPELAALIENKCVVAYHWQSGEYARVE